MQMRVSNPIFKFAYGLDAPNYPEQIYLCDLVIHFFTSMVLIGIAGFFLLAPIPLAVWYCHSQELSIGQFLDNPATFWSFGLVLLSGIQIIGWLILIVSITMATWDKIKIMWPITIVKC